MSDLAQTSAGRRQAWLDEVRATLALSWPIILTNLLQIALTTTDVVMVGRLGPDSLAACVLGANFFFAFVIFGIGLVSAVAPMVARERGIRSYAVRDVRRTVRQGLWSAIAISIPVWVILWFAEPILLALGQNPDTTAHAAQYLSTLQWSFLPFLGYITMRNFIAAVERPLWGIWSGGIGFVVNAAAAWCLIFGELGFPKLGLFGAGIATTFSSTAMFGVLALVALFDRRFRRYHIFGRFWRPDWRRFRQLWALGLPIAATLVFEVSIFNGAVILMGLIGKTALAAHSIAIQIASVAFMVPLGFGQAVTVRVGRAFGAGDRAAMTPRGLDGVCDGRRLHGTDREPHALRAASPDRRVPRSECAGESTGRGARRRLPGDRGNLPARRRRAGGRLRDAPRPSRYACADDLRRSRLLGDRLAPQRHLGLPARPRRRRHLDGARLRPRRRCRVDDRPLAHARAPRPDGAGASRRNPVTRANRPPHNAGKGALDTMDGAEDSSAETPALAGLARVFARFGTLAAAERLLGIFGILIVLVGTLPTLPAYLYPLLTVVCVAVSLAFAAFYVLRVMPAHDRRRHALSGPAIIDLLAAAPVPLALLVGTSGADARLFGILWALKLIRLNPAFMLLWRVLRSERQPLLSVTTAFLVVTLFASTIAFVVERNAQPDAFGSVPAALWWAVTTITTTGYGDKIPASFIGRVLGGSVMIAGIGLFALWAGILASGFAAELRRREFLESWDLVVRLPLFRKLGAAALSEIARLLKAEDHAPGSMIVRAGQPGDSMFFIAEGEVEVHAGAAKISLKTGQFFGEAALITGAPRNATVVATTTTRLLRLDVIDFRELAARQPELLATIENEDAHRKVQPS